MTSFVRPNLLGTAKEFKNGFVNPITNGQHKDSTHEDVMIMKRRGFVLHRRLNGIVNRQDFSSKENFLNFIIFKFKPVKSLADLSNFI
jgi:transcriptional regulator ATRX